MNQTAEILLSRNFVEFGPFTPEEITVFATRGILLEGDFLLQKGTDSWVPCAEWIASITAPQAPPPPATPPKAKKKSAKKAA